MNFWVLEQRLLNAGRTVKSALSLSAALLLGALVWLAVRDFWQPNPLFHPHGFCYLWESDLVGTHVVSDLLIFLSYSTISMTLVYLVRQTRNTIPFGWMFLAFGTFIVACGATHAMEIVTLWQPWFWLSADVKIVTALASVLTAIALPPLVPRIVGVVEAAKISESRRVALEDLNRELESSLKEKELLLKEVHHRVKNNLAVISSIFYLQSTRTPDPDVVRMFEDSQHRVRSMALIHETLYGSHTFGTIDLGEYTRVLSGQLQVAYRATADRVRVVLDVQRVDLTIDVAVPCGLILNELIANAFKHAFPGDRTGTVKLAIRPADGGRCVSEVADDGVGMASVTPDLDRSLGLRLVGSLVRQIRGTVEFVRREPGTLVRLAFPLDEHGSTI